MNRVTKNHPSLALDTGGTATGYSHQIAIDMCNRASVHLVYTDDAADLAATVTVWMSNKDNPGTADDTDWVDITSVCTVPTISGGGDGKAMILVPDSACMGRMLRVKITATTGSGVFTMYSIAKGA